MSDIPNVGSVIRVTTKYRNHLLNSPDEFQYNHYEGTVVPGNRWDEANTFCMTGDKYIAVRNINIKNVHSLEILKGSARAAVTMAGVRAFSVKSKNNVYLVTLNAGKLSCSCIGFQYHRRCRHAAGVAAKIAK